MNNKILIVASLLLILVVNACDDMNDLHQKYLDEGSKVYIGKPDSVFTRAGYNCLRLVWTNNADSKIKKTRIVYNYGNDTITIPFERKVAGYQKDSITLDLDPGDYMFSICNLTDDEKLVSIAVTEVRGKVYGENYKNILSTRSCTASIIGNTAIINWGDITSDYMYSILRHTDNSGAEPVVTEYICENNRYKTEIENVKEGDTFTITSVYIPEENYIGIIESTGRKMEVKLGAEEVDRGLHTRYDGTIAYDNTYDHAWWAAFSNLFNNIYSDAWVTLLSDNNSQNNNQYPVAFTIDLHMTIELAKLMYFMAEGWEFVNPSPKRFEVWGTDNVKTGMPNEYWATTVPGDWQKDWHKLGECIAKQPSGGNNTSVTQEDINFARKGFAVSLNSESKQIRYVRILVYETCDGSVNAGIGELVFYVKALVVE